MTDDEREDTPDDVATPDTDPRHIDPAGDLADAVETGLVEETDAGRYRLALSFGDVDGESVPSKRPHGRRRRERSLETTPWKRRAPPSTPYDLCKNRTHS